MKPTLTKPKPKWEEKIIPLEEKKCNHVFEFVSGGECQCKKCHFGLIGVFDIQNNKPV